MIKPRVQKLNGSEMEAACCLLACSDFRMLSKIEKQNEEEEDYEKKTKRNKIAQ